MQSFDKQASYVSWNSGYFKSTLYEVGFAKTKAMNKTYFKEDEDNIRANRNLIWDLTNHNWTFFQGSTELIYNATRYLQPSGDPTLQCSVLVKYTNVLRYDLVSVPCGLRFHMLQHAVQYNISYTKKEVIKWMISGINEYYIFQAGESTGIVNSKL